MRTVAEIDADIAKVQNALQNVHGNEAEVYTRIVGYYRSVRNWNKGKREEYNHRKLFEPDALQIAAHNGNDAEPCSTVHNRTIAASDNIARIALFTRETCPNCPPVKKFCQTLCLPVSEYNVDTEAGFSEAAKNAVRSAPTVICYDKNGNEITRAFSVSELEKLLPVAEKLHA